MIVMDNSTDFVSLEFKEFLELKQENLGHYRIIPIS